MRREKEAVVMLVVPGGRLRGMLLMHRDRGCNGIGNGGGVVLRLHDTVAVVGVVMLLRRRRWQRGSITVMRVLMLVVVVVGKMRRMVRRQRVGVPAGHDGRACGGGMR